MKSLFYGCAAAALLMASAVQAQAILGRTGDGAEAQWEALLYDPARHWARFSLAIFRQSSLEASRSRAS